MFVKGIRVSYPQLELHRLIGRGVINYKTRCGLRPDFAFVHKGRKVAVEYDEQFWHNEEKDLAKTMRLMKDGWKVIRILVHNKFPDQNMLSYVKDALSTENDYSRMSDLMYSVHNI